MNEQLQQILRRRTTTACSCSGVSGGNMCPAMLATTTPAPPGAITFANSSSASANAEKVNGQNRGGGGLDGDSPAVCADLGDAAERRRFLGKRADGFSGRHVDRAGLHLVAVAGQRRGGRLQRLVVVVGKKHRLARAEAPGDGLAHTADTDDDQNVRLHRHLSHTRLFVSFI